MRVAGAPWGLMRAGLVCALAYLRAGVRAGLRILELSEHQKTCEPACISVTCRPTRCESACISWFAAVPGEDMRRWLAHLEIAFSFSAQLMRAGLVCAACVVGMRATAPLALSHGSTQWPSPFSAVGTAARLQQSQVCGHTDGGEHDNQPT